MKWHATFVEKGYIVVPADDMAALNQLRHEIFFHAQKVFGQQAAEPESFFNNFHNLQITGTQLNEQRVKLIRNVTEAVDSGSLLFRAFESTINSLLGPDLLVQKNTNLVIQQPNDPNPSELHRDAPANSPYEVVVWVPLVNCFKTKCMYIVDRQNTERAMEVLKAEGDNWESFEKYCLDHSDETEIPYGTGLFFWPGLFHGSKINAEKETRWSLNMRYKSVFSPNGHKEPFEFFKLFKLSPLTKLAMDYQKKEDFS